ncbi:hypothetical protein [Bacillus cereus]
MKQNRNYVWFLLASLSILIFLSGCWSSKEIEELSLASGVVLDKSRLK